MQREMVMTLLCNYTVNKGRLAHLDITLATRTAALQHLRTDAISGEALHGISADQGSGHTGKISRPVEDLAVRLADGWIPEAIEQEMEIIRKLQHERDTVAEQVEYVDVWLAALQERERWVIIHQIINAESWRDIIGQYRDAFAEHACASKNTIKRIKCHALEKIFSMAE